nr:protein 5 [Beet oak leaf virus]
MTWLSWVEKIHTTVKIVSKIIDTVTEGLNCPNPNNHTAESIGVAVKHIRGLSEGVGLSIPRFNKENVHQFLEELHEEESRWASKIVGEFLLHGNDDIKISSVPTSLVTTVTNILSYYDYSARSTDGGNHHPFGNDTAVKKLDEMIERCNIWMQPPGWCGESCDHNSKIECLAKIKGRKRETFADLGFARLVVALSNDFNDHETKLLTTTIDHSIEAVASVLNGPKSMVQRGHVLGHDDYDKIVTLQGQLRLLDGGCSSSYLLNKLLIIKAIVLLTPYTQRRGVRKHEHQVNHGTISNPRRVFGSSNSFKRDELHYPDIKNP